MKNRWFKRIYTAAMTLLICGQTAAQVATVVTAGGTAPRADGQVHVDKDNFEEYFQTLGNATYSATDGIVTLTQDENNQVGNFSLKNKIAMDSNFTLVGQVNLGAKTSNRNGADGIGFAFHDGNTNDVGNSGGNLGIGGLQNAIGFKLDTWHNDDTRPTANVPGSQVADNDSNGFGWAQDPNLGQFGAFVKTTDEQKTTTSGQSVQRWWATVDQSQDSAKPLAANNLNGDMHDFTVDYNGESKRLTITYKETNGNVLTWTQQVADSHEAMALIVSASTGAACNLQQFKIISFDYTEAATVNVRYVDTEGTSLAQGLVTYPDGPNVGNPYTTEQLAIPGYTFIGMDDGTVTGAASLPVNGTLAKPGNNGDVVYVYSHVLGSATLTKTDDSDAANPLKDATFALFKADDTQVGGSYTTDESGKLTVNNLLPGSYYFKETQAPAGYEGSDDQIPFTITMKGITQTVQVSAVNTQKTGAVVLTKTDSDTDEALPGAVFDLYGENDDKTPIKTGLTTDDNGQIKVDGLKPGNYYFVETSAPAGYEFEKEQIKFTVELQTEAHVASASAQNTKKTGAVTLTKTDNEDGTTLEGAVFDLYNAKDEKIKSDLATDKDGQISVTGLKPGHYYFMETKAPAGYDLDASKLEFEVALQTVTKIATVAAKNVKKTGSVVLTKTDSDEPGELLAGAVFDLYNKAGDKIASDLTTKDNGQVTVENLKPGDYYFVETQAPAGYELNEAQLPFTVELQTETKVATVSATNVKKTGAVVLSKTDNDTGKPLSGATFTLFKSDGTSVEAGLITDDKGQITVTDLKPGDYYFVETAAPAGYELNDSQLHFTVVLQTTVQVAQVAATNVQKTGAVILTKTDQDTGKVLPGATFALYKEDGTQLAEHLVTNANGQIVFEGLKPGNYYFVETAAPDGYVLDDSKLSFTVELQTEAKVVTVSAKNEKKTGSVLLTKTDGDAGKILPGAKFNLYAEDDETPLHTGLTSDDKGQITVNDLKPGNYYFVETAAPDGYVLDDNKLPFTVELQTETKVATVSAKNEQKTGSVVLTKTDSDTGKILPGATFSLFKSDGTLVEADLTTNQAGQITVNDLKPGNYYFVETATPDGYVLDDSKLEFEVVLQTETKVATVSAKNEQKTGSVLLTKTDSDTGKILPGAKFNLYTENDGTPIKTGLTTDEQGQITVEGLKPGNYYFVETATPDGYVLDDSKLPFTVELQTEAKVVTVSAKNEQKTGSVLLTKTDGDTGKILPGAKFNLYAEDDETPIKTDMTTDDKGQITVNDLKPGNYYFVETAAPAGYKLDRSQHRFTVALQTGQAAVEVTVKNYKNPTPDENVPGPKPPEPTDPNTPNQPDQPDTNPNEQLPATGDETVQAVTLIGLLTLSTLVGFTWLKGKKKAS